MTSNVVTCSLCSDMPHVNFKICDYLKLLRLFHVHQADFRVSCGISECQRSYTNMGRFQNHVYSMDYCRKVKDVSSSQVTDAKTQMILLMKSPI